MVDDDDGILGLAAWLPLAAAGWLLLSVKNN